MNRSSLTKSSLIPQYCDLIFCYNHVLYIKSSFRQIQSVDFFSTFYCLIILYHSHLGNTILLSCFQINLKLSLYREEPSNEGRRMLIAVSSMILTCSTILLDFGIFIFQVVKYQGKCKFKNWKWFSCYLKGFNHFTIIISKNHKPLGSAQTGHPPPVAVARSRHICNSGRNARPHPMFGSPFFNPQLHFIIRYPLRSLSKYRYPGIVFIPAIRKTPSYAKV